MKRIHTFLLSLALVLCSGLVFGSAASEFRNGALVFYDDSSLETLLVVAPEVLWQDFQMVTTTDVATATESIRPLVCDVVNAGTWAVVSGTATRLLLTTGSADDDDIELAGPLSFFGSKFCVMEARVRVDAPTCAFNVGFTDAQTESADLLPIVCANVQGVTSTASDAALFWFDADTTTDYIRYSAVANDVDSASGVAYSTAITTNALAQTWRTYRVEVDDSGNADFWLDGSHIGQISAGVSPGVALCPYVGLINRSGAARQLDIEYVRAWNSKR